MDRHPQWHAGYEAGMQAIRNHVWASARDEFNAEFPPGAPLACTAAEMAHADGRYQALCDRMPAANQIPHNLHRGKLTCLSTNRA